MSNFNTKECCFCLDSIDKVNYSITKCGHIVHTSCLVHWIKIGKDTCPLCRSVLIDETVNNMDNPIIIYSHIIDSLNRSSAYIYFVTFMWIITILITYIFNTFRIGIILISASCFIFTLIKFFSIRLSFIH